MIDLAQSRLGTKIVYKTDEFFAPAKRIINPWPPIFKEGVFDKHGKWMDGWETRRKRNKGHDYLILKLGRPGKIRKVDIDTSYFNGNQPSKVSLDACYSKNKSKIEILSSFRKRISYDITVEFEEAKKQVKKIASLRLNEINIK